jgi:hypothetical protein
MRVVPVGTRAQPGSGGAALERSVLRPRKGIIAWRAEPRGQPRLPLCAERPGDVFNPSVLNVRKDPGASHLIERHTSKRSVCADIRQT